MDYNEMLQLVFELAITILLPIFLGMAIGAVRTWWTSVKARIPQEQYEFAFVLAKQLVLAAEQSGLAGMIKNDAETKKNWVLDRMEKGLADNGIELDLHTLSDMIEAAVKTELNPERTSASG